MHSPPVRRPRRTDAARSAPGGPSRAATVLELAGRRSAPFASPRPRGIRAPVRRSRFERRRSRRPDSASLQGAELGLPEAAAPAVRPRRLYGLWSRFAVRLCPFCGRRIPGGACWVVKPGRFFTVRLHGAVQFTAQSRLQSRVAFSRSAPPHRRHGVRDRGFEFARGRLAVTPAFVSARPRRARPTRARLWPRGPAYPYTRTQKPAKRT